MNWLKKASFGLQDLLAPLGGFRGVGSETGSQQKDGVSVFRDQFGSSRYVLYISGQAVSGMQVVSDGERAVISNMFTHPEHRRKGHAKKLYEYIKQDFPVVEFSKNREPDGKAFIETIENKK